MTATSARRTFAPTVVLGLAAAGLTTVAGNQTWATATSRSNGDRADAAQGADVAPLVLPLGLVALAAWGAVLVLRRRGRRVVAGIGVAATLGAAVSAATNAGRGGAVARDLLGDPSGATTAASGWPWVALASAMAGVACFLLAWRAAPGWPEMSSRYDTPTGSTATGGTDGTGTGGTGREGSAPVPSDRDLWRALDEGHDPTV